MSPDLPYPLELVRTLLELRKAGRIYEAEYNRLRAGEALEVTDKLHREGRISYKQLNKIERAIERDRKAQAKARKKPLARLIANSVMAALP
jgi:RIO-like serine/threonine protein kinase